MKTISILRLLTMTSLMASAETGLAAAERQVSTVGRSMGFLATFAEIQRAVGEPIQAGATKDAQGGLNSA
jgi:hypothetical protein